MDGHPCRWHDRTRGIRGLTYFAFIDFCHVNVDIVAKRGLDLVRLTPRASARTRHAATHRSQSSNSSCATRRSVSASWPLRPPADQNRRRRTCLSSPRVFLAVTRPSSHAASSKAPCAATSLTTLRAIESATPLRRSSIAVPRLPIMRFTQYLTTERAYASSSSKPNSIRRSITSSTVRSSYPLSSNLRRSVCVERADASNRRNAASRHASKFRGSKS